jgi:hypothetical protein
MIKRGRPKIYYNCCKSTKQVEEPLDFLLRNDLISLLQHRLCCKLRWLFTLSFGLPTVQAYNAAKVKGRGLPRYDEEILYEKRQEYKQKNIEMIKTAAANLEKAYKVKRKVYNVISKHEYCCTYAN